MEKSIEGVSEACRQLNIPVISGNVSMYNQSYGEPIFPTPIIGIVGLFESLNHITPNSFQHAGDVIYVIGEADVDFGGSELQKLVDGKYSGQAPQIDLHVEKERQEQLLDAIKAGIIVSAEDIAEGGLAVTLAEKAIRGNKGVHVKISGDPTVQLFSESQSRYVVSVKQENVEKFEALGLEAVKVGVVTEEQDFVIATNDGNKLVDEKVDELRRLWKESIEKLLKSN